jgi:type I restriction enzyme, S subunit
MSFPRYQAYKPSGVEWLREVPEHWEALRLRFATQLNPSKQEAKELGDQKMVSFLPMEAIGEHGIIRLEQEKEVGECLSGYTYFRDGDVCIAKITPCFENGKGAILRDLKGGIGFGTTELIVTRPVKEKITSEFLDYLFRSQTFRRLGEAEMYGAGGQKRVPDSFVRDFTSALPSIEEQSQVTRFLDRETAKIDCLIAEQQRLIELLQEKRQAVISHAVTKGLNPKVPMKDSGVEWLGEVPEHWECMPLKRFVSDSNAGEVIDKSHWGGSEELLYTCAIEPLKSDYKGFPEWKRTSDCDLLLTRNGTPYVHKPVTGSIYTNVVQRISLIGGCNRSYVAISLQNSANNLKGYGVSIESLNYQMWSGLALPMPPAHEQAEILEDVSKDLVRFDLLMQESEAVVGLLQERRSALISAAVTGQIDVRGLVEAEVGEQ